MISVVIYGRNDNYGYNLHKRASLSLNCIARVLSDPADEILFVDYNTPDDFPTFPEAIRDTLTKEARSRLRILRVRPEIHRRFEARTHLSALEPIARNVAIRRSNPANRWILSTNSDMIFVPLQFGSLTEIVRDLPSGFYHLPRFDVPESLWETFDRLDPRGVIETMKNLGEVAHLNEIVLGAEHIRYDAPGDFQLLTRRDLFEIYGFSEDMLLGWHVDSNLAKRLFLRHGKVGDLTQFVRAYHCEHTRSFSTMHYTRKSNDTKRFIDDITEAGIPSQKNTWGCVDDVIEELQLASCPSDSFKEIISRVVGPPMRVPTQIAYIAETSDRVNYDPEHVLPYLGDLFVNCPRDWNVGWFGGRLDTLRLFERFWKALGFEGKILVGGNLSHFATRTNLGAIEIAELPIILGVADTFVFDFGEVTGAGRIEDQSTEYMKRAGSLLRDFWAVVDAEQIRSDQSISGRRRIVTINTVHGYLQKTVEEVLSCPKMGISKRMRYGMVRDRVRRVELLDQLEVGPAGERFDQNIRTRPGVSGHVFYGPYVHLQADQYRATVELVIDSKAGVLDSGSPPFVLEVAARDQYLAQIKIGCDLERNQHTLCFDLTKPDRESLLVLPIEVRLWTSGHVSARVTSVKMETVEPGTHINTLTTDESAAP